MMIELEVSIARPYLTKKRKTKTKARLYDLLYVFSQQVYYFFALLFFILIFNLSQKQEKAKTYHDLFVDSPGY